MDEKLMGHICVYFILFISFIFTDDLFILTLIHTNLVSNFRHYLNNNLIFYIKHSITNFIILIS